MPVTKFWIQLNAKVSHEMPSYTRLAIVWDFESGGTYRGWGGAVCLEASYKDYNGSWNDGKVGIE